MLTPGGRHMLWLALTLAVVATAAHVAARIRGLRRRVVTPAQITHAPERRRAQFVATGPPWPLTPTLVPATSARVRHRR